MEFCDLKNARSAKFLASAYTGCDKCSYIFFGSAVTHRSAQRRVKNVEIFLHAL
jgi:hypothetical protein